jgi:hypothetical protein
MWDRLKRLFGKQPPAAAALDPHLPPAAQKDLPDCPWIPADQNPWAIPVIDVRPITLTMLSTSTNALYAQNAISFATDDGRSFINHDPPNAIESPADLHFRRDRLLAPGALFLPDCMEHKWALFFHENRILCVRSWTRTVALSAAVEQHDDRIHITSIRRDSSSANDPPRFAERLLDFLLRSHALQTPFPAPLPQGMAETPSAAGLWCMSTFGKLALVAAEAEPPMPLPEKPLRTHSLLHIAVARKDIPAIHAQLAAGIPIDIRDPDGLSPLHWACADDSTAMLEELLRCGCPIDVHSDQGATPLMQAVQARHPAQVTFLLEHGADPNAGDSRGFTALHRSAEMGELDITKTLLAHGANPAPEAEGNTPLSLAQARNEAAIIALLTTP